MNVLVAVAAAMDLALLGAFFWRLRRSWEAGHLAPPAGSSARWPSRCFSGALATGLYATAVDLHTLGFAVRFARVAPRAFVLASAFLPIAGTAAALVGRLIARPVEALTAAAERIAEGERGSELLPGGGEEGRKLSRALAAMRREIADKPHASAFLRDAWHDLKTPVAAIVATLEVLEDGAIDDPAAARRFLANLRRSAASQLEKRLADIVTLAAVLRLRPIAASSATPTWTGSCSPRARRAGAARSGEARASFPPGPQTATSPTRAPMRRSGPRPLALGNFARERDPRQPWRARFASRSMSRAPGVIGIDIVNEPSGIPAEVRGRLFQRASSSRGYSGGSGLGLPIARAAIEAHGGRVRFIELGPPRVAVRIELPR